MLEPTFAQLARTWQAGDLTRGDVINRIVTLLAAEEPVDIATVRAGLTLFDDELQELILDQLVSNYGPGTEGSDFVSIHGATEDPARLNELDAERAREQVHHRDVVAPRLRAWVARSGIARPAGIRRALPSDADELTRVAHTSKAHWGYDAAFLDAARADLTLDPAFIAAHEVYLYEERGVALGFYSLMPVADATSVEHVFVHPKAIGMGVGGRLFRHLVETARAAGVKRLRIASDPNAEGFYLHQGARRVGSVASIIAGRMLPLLELDL